VSFTRVTRGMSGSRHSRLRVAAKSLRAQPRRELLAELLNARIIEACIGGQGDRRGRVAQQTRDLDRGLAG